MTVALCWKRSENAQGDDQRLAGVVDFVGSYGGLRNVNDQIRPHGGRLFFLFCLGGEGGESR